MDWWYKDNDSYLFRKTLEDAVNPFTLGVLVFSGNYVNVETVKNNLNSLLSIHCPSLKDKIGVKLANAPKDMIKRLLQS